MPLQLTIDHRAPLRHRGFQIQSVKPLPHFVARTVALQETQRWIKPVAARSALFGGHHLDTLAVLQWRIQRHHRTVDPRATATVPKIAVQVVGKINRRRIGG